MLEADLELLIFSCYKMSTPFCEEAWKIGAGSSRRCREGMLARTDQKPTSPPHPVSQIWV